MISNLRLKMNGKALIHMDYLAHTIAVINIPPIIGHVGNSEVASKKGEYASLMLVSSSSNFLVITSMQRSSAGPKSTLSRTPAHQSLRAVASRESSMEQLNAAHQGVLRIFPKVQPSPSDFLQQIVTRHHPSVALGLCHLTARQEYMSFFALKRCALASTEGNSPRAGIEIPKLCLSPSTMRIRGRLVSLAVCRSCVFVDEMPSRLYSISLPIPPSSAVTQMDTCYTVEWIEG